MKKLSKKTPAQKLTSRLDVLCSEIVRRRAIQRVGGCERCLTKKYDQPREDGFTYPAWMTLQWCHFIGRTAHSVRWDLDNAAGLCGGCHTYLDSRSREKEEFIVAQIGEQGYDLLIGRERMNIKADKQLLLLYLKNKLEELDGGI